MSIKIISLLIFILNTLIAIAQPGLVDYTFRTDFECKKFVGNNPSLTPIAVQRDGKIITGGNCRLNFTNGSTQDNLFRLNTDGSLDTTFKVGKGSANSINLIYILPNDKILISCSVSCIGLNLDGKLYPGAVLLNPNGSVDSNFHKTLFKHLDRILSMAVRKDEIAVYGLNGNIRLLLKFKIDGSLDTSFKKSILTPEQGSSSGRDIFYLSDGRLIHRRTDTTTWRESLYIFKSDGTKDKSFILDNEVQLNGLSQIIEQKDGKILLFGALYTLSDLSYNGILRLNPDGSLDKTFTIPIQLKDNLLTNVRSALIQRDNKILLCGSFNGFDENFRIFLLRLNQDGSLDKSFVIKDAFNFTVFEIANYYNGKVLVSGIFDSYGSFITGRIARVNILNQDDSQIYVFPNPNNGIFNVDAQREITLVVVTDILGREVYRYVPSNPNIEIDISDKAKGTYFLSIFSTDQRNVKKIMKL